MQDSGETMKCVCVGTDEIEYSERGEGEPLLLVHGGVFANWFAPMFASHTLDGFRIIRVRRAGYGPRVPKNSLTIQDHANHLAGLAHHLGLEKVHFLGHSFSGLIGLQLAISHPKLVHSLILLEPAPCGPLQVPAVAELGRRFVGPAMDAFGAGNLSQAFDSFMTGICGDLYRPVIERSLGKAAYEQAVLESEFFSATRCRPP
jgi:pimeloyl-ACP methyl ester carboxylesterase